MTLSALHSEVVGGGPGYARVRITGTGTAAAHMWLAPPTVLVADGPQWRRIATVPGTAPIEAGPGAPPFAVELDVPLHLLVGGGAWWLEPGARLRSGATLPAAPTRVVAIG